MSFDSQAYKSFLYTQIYAVLGLLLTPLVISAIVRYDMYSQSGASIDSAEGELFKQSLIYLAGMAVIALLVYFWLSRKSKQTYEDPSGFPSEIQSAIRRMNGYRGLLYLILFFIGIAAQQLMMWLMDDIDILLYEHYPVSFLLEGIVRDTIAGMVGMYAMGYFFKLQFSKTYKKRILSLVLKGRKEQITLLQNACCSSMLFARMGFLGPLQDSLKLTKLVRYQSKGEDLFNVQTQEGEFNFFECNLDEIKGAGKYATTSNVFHGIILMLPNMGTGNLAFHIAPPSFGDKTTLPPYTPPCQPKERELAMFCNDSARMDEIIQSSRLYDAIDAITRKMEGTMDNRSLYILSDSTLYLVVKTYEDRFDADFPFVFAEDIISDQNYIDLMCFAGQQLSQFRSSIPTH